MMTRPDSLNDTPPAGAPPELGTPETDDLITQTLAEEGWEAAAIVIESNWDRLVTTAPHRLLAAIRALPGEAFVDRPTFLVAANYLQHVVSGTDAGSYNHDGWLDADMSGREIGLISALGVLTSRSAGARTSGDLADARRAAEQGRAALAQASEQERAAIRSSLPHFLLQWGRSRELADAPGADFEYEQAYELAILTDQALIARRAAAQHAWLSAERGRVRTAELWLARARGGSAPNGRYDAVIYLTDALIRLDRGDRVGAERELARAAGLGSGEYWAAMLWVQSMYARDAAEAAVIDARLAQYLAQQPTSLAASAANGRYTRAARARLAVLRRQSATAPTMRPGLSATDRVISAALAHVARKHQDALDLAGEAAAPEEPPRTQTAALLVTAAAALALGQRETAALAFVQAHAIIEHERLYSAYDCVPSGDLDALAELTSLRLPELLSAFHQPRTDHVVQLTKREHEVLALLAQGRSMSELAEALFISPNTLKSTVRRLYRRLGVNSRASAIDTARRFGLI